MNLSTWIAIFLPIFILLFVIIPEQQRASLNKIKKKRGNRKMANDIIKKYIGKNCIVSSGSFGTTITGKISAVEDNWIEIITKKGNRIVNADYVTFITETSDK